MKRSSHQRKRKKATATSWKLVYKKFQPAEEGLREALCTLGNGYFASRGAESEVTASRIHYPGTYIAGLYNKVGTHISGRTIYNEDLVNVPNWLFLTFRIGNGEWISPSTSKTISYNKELDMQRGILRRKMCVQDRSGCRTLVETERIVHMVDPHRAAIRYAITPENYDAKITVRSELDGAVQNTGVARYRQLNCQHLKSVSLGNFDKNGTFLSVKTSNSHTVISLAATVRVNVHGKWVKPATDIITRGKKAIAQENTFTVHKRKKYIIEKIVSIYTSRDRGVRNAQKAAITSVRRSPQFDKLCKSHVRAWATLWRKVDIKVEGDSFAQRIFRLHTFHLLQTASIHNASIDAGMPARGLHGEAYRGHIFWDELFVMPFFDLHEPGISQALLVYRYRRLPQARKYAKENGYKGAMFPWQSGAAGTEETQIIHLNPMSGKWDPDHSCIQRHVSFAIAYNFWQHWMRTQDFKFLLQYGAEVLLSIARFANSLTYFKRRDGRYHTEGIMGPDEFHEKVPGEPDHGLKDNAYTNVLIVWTLRRALEVLDILPKAQKTRLMKKVGLGKGELQRWIDITRKMNIVVNADGIISQFDGYFDLQELNWNAYRKKYSNIHRMDRILKAEGKSPNDYKVAKQADFLMLFYLLPLAEIKTLFNQLGYHFDKRTLIKNYDYYLKRTSHGSTLSKVVHCYVSILLGKGKESWQWFYEVLKSDIHDTQGGTTTEGVHTGVMAGSLNIVLRCFAGVQLLDDRINIVPSLPNKWNQLTIKFLYRGHWLTVSVSKYLLTIFIEGPRSQKFSTPVAIFGKPRILRCGVAHKIDLHKKVRIKKVGVRIPIVQERILIVDGDVATAEILTSRLEAMGYIVEYASNGKEALDILKTEWIDLIIQDLLLQGEIDGVQMFKAIKKNSSFNKTPIIITSSKIAMKKTFERMGAEAFFAKPYTFTQIIRRIKAIVSRH